MAEGEFLHGGAERLPTRWLTAGEPPMRVSRYRIAPGGRCSLHVHTGKAECWLVVEGTGVAQLGEREIPVAPGDLLLTEPETPHALRNTGAAPLVFVNFVVPVGGEISTRELEEPAGR